jgi:hypothetical protein
MAFPGSTSSRKRKKTALMFSAPTQVSWSSLAAAIDAMQPARRAITGVTIVKCQPEDGFPKVERVAGDTHVSFLSLGPLSLAGLGRFVSLVAVQRWPDRGISCNTQGWYAAPQLSITKG